MKPKRSLRILFFFVVLCMGFTLVGYGQQTEQEILKKLEGATEEEKVTLMIDLSKNQAQGDLKKALDWAQKGKDQAEKLGNKILQADAYNQLGYIKLLDQKKEQASALFQKAYKISVEQGYDKGAGFSQNGYGLLWLQVDDYAKALEDFDKAQDYFQKSEYELGEAFTMNNRGTVYEAIGEYEQALKQYLAALKIYEKNDEKKEMAVTYNNIGSVNNQMGNGESALEHYTLALKLSEKLNNKIDMASTLNNMGILYARLGYHKEALSFLDKAYNLSFENEDATLVATTLSNIASVYEGQGDFDKALEYYGRALSEYDKINDLKGLVSIFNNVGTLYSKKDDHEMALKKHLMALNLAKKISYREGLESVLHNLSLDYKALGDYEQANKYLTLHGQMREHVRNENVAKKFADAQTFYQTEKKDAEIESQKQELDIQALRMRLILIILSAVGLFLIIVVILSIRIYKERQKSEKLLLNILPKKVADTLKKFGETEPENFPEVTMYFSDIVGFTNTSKNLDPKFLIEELNDIFTTFDNIMERHGCERIKTIGDAYMGVCGLPAPNENHAQNIARASMEIVEALENRNKKSSQIWEIRVGIHTGRVTGGIVGVKKYIYDVFGDTVNTAARMESHSEPMRVNVSQTTYERLKDQFLFEKRQPLVVKGKGLFQMYFLKEEKTEKITLS